jgi:hypothetical protein
MPILEIVGGFESNLGLTHTTQAVQEKLPPGFASSIAWWETCVQFVQDVISCDEEATNVT